MRAYLVHRHREECRRSCAGWGGTRRNRNRPDDKAQLGRSCWRHRERPSRQKSQVWLLPQHQCDQIGRFWKFLLTNSLSKVPKYLVTFWDFWKVTFKVKTSVVILWQLLEENWLLKNLTSGHTAPDWWVHRWLQNFMICDLRLLPVLRADGWVSRYQRWFARRLRWSTDRWSSHKRACQNTFPPRWIKI